MLFINQYLNFLTEIFCLRSTRLVVKASAAHKEEKKKGETEYFA